MEFRVPTWYVAENKEVPDRNIGVPPVRKYANYRTLRLVYPINQSDTYKASEREW